MYHPEFGGSFSLKVVVPVLVPDASYEDLEIADGSTAASTLGRLLLDSEMPNDQKARLRAQLLAYCARDTEVMVRLVECLRGLASRRAPP